MTTSSPNSDPSALLTAGDPQKQQEQPVREHPVREQLAAAADPKALEVTLAYQFVGASLLRQSLTHRSWCAEHGGASNERLEFLGDSVLGLVVTRYMFEQFPQLPEGDLAKLRASVVNSITLAEIAREIALGDYLLLGKGEHATGGREKASILADSLEAVIGAVYIDGGWGVAESIVLRLFTQRMHEYSEGPGGGDYKTRLQELAARRFEHLPIYRVVGAGPDHAKVFDAEVFVGGTLRGTGSGRSKKQAEQEAARMAWQALLAIAET